MWNLGSYTLSPSKTKINKFLKNENVAAFQRSLLRSEVFVCSKNLWSNRFKSNSIFFPIFEHWVPLMIEIVSISWILTREFCDLSIFLFGRWRSSCKSMFSLFTAHFLELQFDEILTVITLLLYLCSLTYYIKFWEESKYPNWIKRYEMLE